ncbi:tetratricopeptide repeat protein [Kordia algicida OT-1]|uniref:Polyphosphate kinase n=1 Tax=Kordia algicida OT-1 TaxID=391587 RepID=A9E3W0_9FLAO|nr:tetratricopeptide repeat protein [Kordia algicida]EDP95278.1 polyphosphate kinase [Kordia algicida OT-1]
MSSNVNVLSFITNVILISLILFLTGSCQQQKQPEREYNIEELIDKIEANLNTDFEKATIYSNQLMAYALAKNDSITIAKAYLQKGIVLTKKGTYQTAIDTLNKGLTFIANKQLPEKNLFLLRIGNAYVQDKKDEVALTYYSRVYEDAFSNDKKKDLLKAAINIAKIKRNAGNYEEALENYKTSYQKAVELHMKKPVIARTLMGIGGTFLTLKKPDSALYYSKKGYEISKAINDKVGQSYFNVDFGIAYYLKDNYKTSLSYLNKAQTYIESIENKKRLAETLFYIGACHYRLKEYQKAIDYLEKVILVANQSEKVNDDEFKPLQLIDTYDFLSKSYIALGNSKQSRIYETARNELEQITDKENNKINTELLKSELRIRDKVIETINHTTNRYKIILGIVIILCLASVYFLIHYKRKAKANKENFEKLIKQQEQKTTKPIQKSKKIKIDNEKITFVLKNLSKVEGQEYYLDCNCTLANLAKKVKTNPTYLTKILKEEKGKTFYQYLNELRINYAITRLKADKQFRKYAIKHIALEVGYKSPESFTKHFKKATGIYPSYYIKELEKRNN